MQHVVQDLITGGLVGKLLLGPVLDLCAFHLRPAVPRDFPKQIQLAGVFQAAHHEQHRRGIFPRLAGQFAHQVGQPFVVLLQGILDEPFQAVGSPLGVDLRPLRPQAPNPFGKPLSLPPVARRLPKLAEHIERQFVIHQFLVRQGLPVELNLLFIILPGKLIQAGFDLFQAGAGLG